MTGDNALCEGVRTLLGTATGFLPATGLGVVRPDGSDHVVFTYVDAFGATAYRAHPSDLPEPVRPRAAGLLRLSAAALDANPVGLVESRLMHSWVPDDIRSRFAVRDVVTVPVCGADRDTTFMVGLSDAAPLTADQISGIDSLAARVVEFLGRVESPHDELKRLRRLDAVDKLVPAFFRVLDVREIFDRLSAITRDVLRHDFASVGMFYREWTEIELYVQTSEGPFPRERSPMIFPPAQTSTFLYRIIDDLAAHPLERGWESIQAGGRTSIRVAVRLDETVLGALNFTSCEPVPYTAQDLAVAQRIAEYVALALSHHRLAEESRRAAALQERAANLEMLDGLLATLTGVLDIREVFDRVSQIAQKVLPHDAMGLPILTDDREHVIPFATSGFPSGTVPLIQPIPLSVRPLLTEAWDFQIVDDLQIDPEGRVTPFARLGYRSYLRVPIRLGGELVGILAFFLRARGAYTQADALIARRIADHVALVMSHQRLAEQARLNEELRARAGNLELLDELLTSVTDTGSLPDIFGRMSDLAQKVLAHDALVLTALQGDGRQARVYASKTPDTEAFPDVVEMPAEMIDNREWEHEIVDDLQARPDQRNMEATKRGYRAALRVPIRLEGNYVAGVSFLSFTPKRYGPPDVAVARRIADRMTLSFARERAIVSSRRADEAAARAARLEARVRVLTEELDARTGYRRVVGQSAQWRQVLTQAMQVAPTEATVLLLGESGTGKEVVARFLHRASSRKDGPFVALNCAALPEQLLEAELFGYERGAFTGAMQSKPGQLEQAAGGLLFLDEVGEMSLPAQAKFLRVLQEREFQRLGGTRVLRTDARIVAATNRDLQRAIAQGQFREDLYYRLNVFAIHLPALRERHDDILPLSEAFLAEIGRGLGRPAAGISREARALLLDYHWPGNVRELRNVLERASILCDGGLITAEHLSLKTAPRRQAPAPPAPEPAEPVADPALPASADDLQSIERAMVEQALLNARFNKSKAAKALGLTRQQLYVRMRRYGLE